MTSLYQKTKILLAKSSVLLCMRRVDIVRTKICFLKKIAVLKMFFATPTYSNYLTIVNQEMIKVLHTCRIRKFIEESPSILECGKKALAPTSPPRGFGFFSLDQKNVLKDSESYYSKISGWYY